LAERWRKPVIPLAIEEANPQGIWLPDGRVQGDVTLILEESDVDRMRSGYACAKCLEPFEHSWPERCNVCGAPIRKEQAAYFAREYGGDERLGSRLSLSEELGMLEERRRKQEEQNR